MAFIYHITDQTGWVQALEKGEYKPEAYDVDGFIHFSTFTQVADTARRYYSGKAGLIVLEVNDRDVQDCLRFEAAPTGELFPHVYRTLPITFIQAVYPLILMPDGSFSFPVPPERFEREN